MSEWLGANEPGGGGCLDCSEDEKEEQEKDIQVS
jgi:hypothetical protein